VACGLCLCLCIFLVFSHFFFGLTFLTLLLFLQFLLFFGVDNVHSVQEVEVSVAAMDGCNETGNDLYPELINLLNGFNGASILLFKISKISSLNWKCLDLDLDLDLDLGRFCG
jgi:hypothetical protein